jgi:hypothetical protein
MLIAHNRDTVISSLHGDDMKKHPDADALAERLTAAANKPPVVLAFPVATPLESEVTPPVQPESAETTPTTLAPEPRRRNARKARANAQAAEQAEDNTVPISLRPHRELLKRYVLAASDRTRETGRVISAQQIMLEWLERGL